MVPAIPLTLCLQNFNMASSIADIRKDYILRSLSENDVDANPFRQFDTWWQEAINSEIVEVNAMTLATASADGIPSARIVLLKSYDAQGFVFFTNYNSYKGRHMEENPRACLVFFWKELERQVRITGLVEKVSAGESDEYFHSRPEGSRIGAWASPQSAVISGRQWLEQEQHRYAQEFLSKPVVRPPHWGGYRVKPITIEFWQGRPNRLHDRLQYSLEENGAWAIERLAP
jgi:pyridoxamine 5'-phosphate oxidase